MECWPIKEIMEVRLIQEQPLIMQTRKSVPQEATSRGTVG